MRLGYDAKRIFHNASGLGNYSRDLIRILATQLPQHDYYLYNPKPAKVHRWKGFSNTFEKYPKGIWSVLHSLWRQAPIAKQLQKDGIDLYHGLSGELPKGLRIPSVVTVHDLIFLRYPRLYNPIDVYIHKKKVNHAVRAATKVVAISEQTKADLLAYTQIPKEKIVVIYQGCHPSFKIKLSEEKKQDVRKKYELPERYVLFVGTLEERKNAMSIAVALKESSYSMVFVGKAKAYGEKLKTYIVENNMQKRTLFIDHINMDDLVGIYQNATVFCYPSIFEGFGIPIIEALYSGVPVITTEGGCFSEAGGASSLYVNPKDETQLRNAIYTLFVESEEKRQERIESGYLHVQQFDDAPIASAWNTLYNSLLS